MDALLDFVKERRTLLIVFCIVSFISLVSLVWSWKKTKTMMEGFQDTVREAEKGGGEEQLNKVISNLPPEITAPKATPAYTQEDCAVLKTVRDSIRFIEITKHKETAKGEEIQAARSAMDDQYDQLKCDEYLKKVAAGEIAPPQTKATDRPLPAETPA
jgi:hypothetical protein